MNSRFVSAVVAEAGDSRPAVLVQDYHFALAPRLLRRQLPSSTVVTFWHIPWPRPHLLRSCPWARQLLDGLLGSNILGFQTDEDCTNFVSCVAEWLDADVGRGDETIAYRGRSTRVHTYPVGVEWDGTIVRTTPPAALCRERICRDLALPFDVRLGVGVDRLDYTKGIPQKFLAIERLLEQHPELRGKFVFVQIAEPSRECLPAYREARRQVLETRDRVNERFAGDGIPPIRLLEGHQEADAVYTLYRAADLCYVGSLRDGMNLVAKEFVNARDDERGVLVLSSRAGAARQLRAALLIDPYDIAAAAAALENALAMPQPEQTRRMRLLRFVVRTCSAQWWAEQLLRDANRESGRPTLPARVPARVQVPA